MKLKNFISRRKHLLELAAFMMLCGVALSAHADSGGINLNKTRLVFMANSGQVTVNVNNTSDSPWLITSRMSRFVDGKGNTPFFISPPVLRMEGHSSSLLRIVGDASQLPKDRESLFYLNVSGIPKSNPLSRDNDSGFVSGGIVYSVGNTIKMFYRPEGLVASAEDAAKHLAFSRTPEGIVANNASPYYVSMLSLRLNGRDVKFNEHQQEMIPPFSKATYIVQGTYPLSQSGRATWTAANDLGGVVTGNGEIK
ncbi:molecular chaperone [Enterobacter cloacae complex sp. ESBL7]|uniref:fimbrial biogenesis chaperone n=1 Tax=Enterobacter cloacae complex sp. ESBL7 TaxID=3163325 RepID=UPI00356ADA42